ncbi:hypothetical protein ACIA8O_32040 [Kitasatospora sp. NPDC051853]|uniref:hypothetical protein n=1 Tax=Kitasatospora sp. NPDC051853 TaxID=3364058 RepID=UPI0037AC3340
MLRELREKDGTATAARHDGPSRQARHGRPKPVGARFRLPGFRFSGAAMAMSTVVGISVATTWLVSEQQSVGRLPGVTNVGASPPVPSPDAAPAPSGQSTTPPQPAPSTVAPGPRALGTPTPPVANRLGLGPVRTVTTPPAASPSVPPTPPTASAPGPSPSPSPSAPAPSASPSPSPSPSGSKTSPPGPVGPPPSLAPTGSPTAVQPLAGVAERSPLGQAGTRHTLELTVGEELTALQVEFQLARPEALPGTLPWSTLPGAVLTVLQERGTVIYRFTLPPGLDVAPGSYLFAVHAVDPSPTASPLPTRPAEETWSASAFSLRHSAATTTRGTFR